MTRNLFSDTIFAIPCLVMIAGKAKMNDGHLPLTHQLSLVTRCARRVETAFDDLVADFLGGVLAGVVGNIGLVLLRLGGFCLCILFVFC